MSRRLVGRWTTMIAANTLVMGTFASAIALPASAQKTVASTIPAAADASPTDIFARPITVTIDKASLAQALSTLSEKANVRIFYRIELVSDAKPVSLRAARMPLGTALEQVLTGTHLRPVVSAPNVLTLRPDDIAATQGVLTGAVVNAKTRRPIVGATIVLDDATKGVITDENGAFRLSATPGAHTLHVRGLGFTKQSRQVTVREGEPLAIDILLEPSASVLNEVVVTGTVAATERKAIPTPITVVTAEDIEKRGITRIDQLFRGEIPGVVALDFGNSDYSNDRLGAMATSNVYVRGSADLGGGGTLASGPNPLKTYVDGVELLDPSYLGTIDPKSIERIEIITGPQAATIYGSGAMGGVMQVFTKKGNGHTTPDLTLSLKYGTLESNMSSGLTPVHNHSLTVAGGSGPEFSYSASASYNYSGQWQPFLYSRMMGGQIGVVHTRPSFTASGSISSSLTNNGTSGNGTSSFGTYGGILLERELRATGVWTPFSSAAFFRKRESTTSNQTGSLNVDYRPFPGWQHHLTIGRSQNKFELEPQGPAFVSRSDTMLTVQTATGSRVTAGYNTTFAPRFPGPVTSTLTIGANGSWGDQSSLYGTLTSTSATSYYGASASRTIDNKNWGGFGSWQVGLFDQFFVTAALRGETNPAYGRDHHIDWTPTIGAAYTIERGALTLKVLGSYGKATRPPNPEWRLPVYSFLQGYEPQQFLFLLPNPDLTPEYSSGPQGGIELYYGSVGSLTINRYRQKISSLIQQTSPDSILLTSLDGLSELMWPILQYVNAASIQQDGWETTGSVTLGAFTVKGTYTLSDSRVIEVSPIMTSTIVYRPGDQLAGVITHTGNLSVNYAWHGSSVTLSTNYIGASTMWRMYTFEERDQSNNRMLMYIPRRKSYEDWYAKPGYAKTDVAASQRLNGWISATLNVRNLTNQINSDVGNLFPTLGRQTTVGLSMKFPR